MEKQVKVPCQWKCSAFTVDQARRWHQGHASVSHSSDSCWSLDLYENFETNKSNHNFKLSNGITKLLVQKDRIFLQWSNASCSLNQFKSDFDKHMIGDKLKTATSEPCSEHSGPRCLSGRPNGALNGAKETNVAPGNISRISSITPIKRNGRRSSAREESKTPTNSFTRVKDHVVSPLDDIENSSPTEKLYRSEKDSGSKSRLLENSQMKADQVLFTGSFYGNRRESSSVANGVFGATYGIKRKPGFLSANDVDCKKPRIILNESALMSNRKQLTLDDMSVKKQTQLQGFSNLGNTCYMNAILQSLFCLVPFATDLRLSAQKKIANQENSLCSALARLLQIPRASDTTLDRERLLAKVKDTISKSAKRFSGHEQHDAHEFLSQLLDQLKDEVKASADSAAKSPNENSSPAEESNQNGCNPTINNFESEVKQTITCTACKHEYCSKFILNDISLDLPQGKKQVSIHDCIRHYFQPHLVEYTCTNCKGTSGLVTYNFIRLPRVFILLLKRYKFNSDMASHRKIVENIRIPPYISLQEQCIKDTEPPRQLGSTPYKGGNLPAQPRSYLSSVSKISEKFAFKDIPQRRSKELPQRNSGSTESSTGSAKTSNLSVKYFDEEELKKMSDEDQLEAAMNLSRGHVGPDDESRPDVFTGNCGTPEYEPLILTCEGSSAERPDECDEADMKSPDLSLTPFAPKRSSSLRKILTPDRPEAVSARSLPRRISKELFPAKSEEPKRMETGEPMIDSSESKFDAKSTENDVGRRLQFSESFDATEDKENVLPSGPVTDHDTKPVDEDLDIHGGQTQEQFDADLKLAIELSLQSQFVEEETKRRLQYNLNNSGGFDNPLANENEIDDDDDQHCVDALDSMEAEELVKTVETGSLPHTYRLMSVVSHLGNSSSIGHYVTDIFDISSDQWYTCDDSAVTSVTEESVRETRERSAYIFFYLSKELEDEIRQHRKSSARPCS